MSKFIHKVVWILLIVVMVNTNVLAETSKAQVENPNITKIENYIKSNSINDFEELGESCIKLKITKSGILTTVNIEEILSFDNQDTYNKALDILKQYKILKSINILTLTCKIYYNDKFKSVEIRNGNDVLISKTSFANYDMYSDTIVKISSMFDSYQRLLKVGIGSIFGVILILLVILIMLLKGNKSSVNQGK